MIVVGVDEVGRGCLAGPVVAGAVLLKPGFNPRRLRKWRCDDSKLLTKKQREEADQQIRKIALAIGLGWASHDEIDAVGLTEAIRRAMLRALERISLGYDEIILDGNYNFLAANSKSRAIIKADATVPAVSAASIVAKVARDAFMQEQALVYEEYGFDSHVGYATPYHLGKIKLHGPSPIHRLSFSPFTAPLQQSLLEFPT
jgi:ribonuclease HII